MMEKIESALRAIRIHDRVLTYELKFEAKEPIRRVQQAYKSRILTLVLGAGVSSAVNLPTWGDLVDDLYNDVYKDIRPDLAKEITPQARKNRFNDAILVRHLEIVLGFRSESRQLLRQKLYSTLDESKVSELIAPLCDAFMHINNSFAVNHTITYNFDNILERYLKKSGRTDFTSIFSNQTYPLYDGGLRIYHPHGYLPHVDDDPTDAFLNQAVVFSESDYHTHYLDSGHWANVLQLHHFMNRICLFVGVSVVDPNVRRLLDHARHKTGSKLRHISIQKTKGNPLLDYFIECDLNSLGVSVIWVKEYFDIPRLLFLCSES